MHLDVNLQHKAPRFDVAAEPSPDRSISFFVDSGYAPMPEHRRPRPAGVLLLVVGLIVGTAFVVLIEMLPQLVR